ncbi:unnamed protein product, partial [Didymodactylos carnosus]
SELFQEDLYPDTTAEEHAITADDWINGADANPTLVSMRDFDTRTPAQTVSSVGSSGGGGGGGGSAKQEVVFGKSSAATTKTQQNSARDANPSSTQSSPQKGGNGHLHQQPSSQHADNELIEKMCEEMRRIKIINDIEPTQELQQQSNQTQQPSSPSSPVPSSSTTATNQQISSKLNEIFVRMGDFDKRLQFVEKTLQNLIASSTLSSTTSGQLSSTNQEPSIVEDEPDDGLQN